MKGDLTYSPISLRNDHHKWDTREKKRKANKNEQEYCISTKSLYALLAGKLYIHVFFEMI